MTKQPSEQKEHPWLKYKGDYEKIYYDIWLSDKEVIEHCYPNAGTFHAPDGRVIDGDKVQLFRVCRWQFETDDPTPPVEAVELREQVAEVLRLGHYQIAETKVINGMMKLLQTEITRSQSELIDRLLAEMPKERKVPSFSLLSRSLKKVDVSMAFDGGYNRSLSEVKSILLKAKEEL